MTEWKVTAVAFSPFVSLLGRPKSVWLGWNFGHVLEVSLDDWSVRRMGQVLLFFGVLVALRVFTGTRGPGGGVSGDASDAHGAVDGVD